MSLLTLNAQVVGEPFTVAVENDGRSFEVQTPSGPIVVRTVAETERQAHRAMAMILRRAERPGIPWGLQITVASIQAVYGEWPLLPGPVPPSGVRNGALRR